jgi:hypothetical protein
MKIVQILSGPYDMEGMVWNLCLVSDGEHMWDEEIYYDSLSDALNDFEDLRNEGAIEVEEDFWFDDEEGLDNDF